MTDNERKSELAEMRKMRDFAELKSALSAQWLESAMIAKALSRTANEAIRRHDAAMACGF